MSPVNRFGQEVGDPVLGWAGAARPGRVVLEGRVVRLEPVGPEHVPALFAALCGPANEPLWTYRIQDPPATPEELEGLVTAAAGDPATVTFALVPSETGRAGGLATLMRVDPAQGCLEVGAIVLGRSLQRTRAATEAQALLAGHVFDDLGYRRYEWKCDSANAPSRSAARRLGFSYEGRFRQAMVYKDRNRDTDWFAMTDGDWRRLRPAYDAWLDPANFDAAGRQRVALSELTARALAG